MHCVCMYVFVRLFWTLLFSACHHFFCHMHPRFPTTAFLRWTSDSVAFSSLRATWISTKFLSQSIYFTFYFLILDFFCFASTFRWKFFISIVKSPKFSLSSLVASVVLVTLISCFMTWNWTGDPFILSSIFFYKYIHIIPSLKQCCFYLPCNFKVMNC